MCACCRAGTFACSLFCCARSETEKTTCSDVGAVLLRYDGRALRPPPATLSFLERSSETMYIRGELLLSVVVEPKANGLISSRFALVRLRIAVAGAAKRPLPPSHHCLWFISLDTAAHSCSTCSSLSAPSRADCVTRTEREYFCPDTPHPPSWTHISTPSASSRPFVYFQDERKADKQKGHRDDGSPPMNGDGHTRRDSDAGSASPH